MNVLIESLKRLFKNGQITKEQLKDMIADKKISKDEYEYIVNN